MDPSDNVRKLHHPAEAGGGPAPENSTQQKDTSPADMLRIKQQMYNQCFEMAVHLQAGKSKLTCSTYEAEMEMPECVSELEKVKTTNFNSTLSLHRMQMWHAIREKLRQNDSEAVSLKAVNDRFMTLCSQITQLQQESRRLQEEITETQKKRLEMKRLTHEKIKQMDELKSKKEFPDMEKYKAVLEKGLTNLEKYKKMTFMTQNVLRGILLACKVDWLNDPKLQEIAMSLEEFPISD